MSIFKKNRSINLQLFADAEGGTDTSGAMADNGGFATSNTASKNNPLADVKYGVQDDASSAGVQSNNTGDAGVDLDAEFEELIKGKYKDQYNKRTQDTVQKRVKGMKDTVDKYNSIVPVLDALSMKYGVDASDIDGIVRAVDEDESYWENEALEKGMTVEQAKNFHKINRENAEMKRQQQQDQAAKIYAGWMQQAEDTKTVYPSFDFDSEMEDPKFKELLKIPGVDVRTAYELTHKDDIIRGAMQFTAQAVKEKTVNQIRANGTRPVENGIGSKSSAVTKSDVSQLTKEDRAEIARRVRMGDKIRF